MKLFIAILLVVFTFSLFDLQAQSIIYQSPQPGSLYNNEETNIIIGYQNYMSVDDNNLRYIEVRGSKSGVHTGKISLVQNNRIIFKPDTPFKLGERVTVRGIKGAEDYAFSIRRKHEVLKPDIYKEINLKQSKTGNTDLLKMTDTLPIMSVFQNGPSTGGYIFLANFGFSSFFIPGYLMILKNSGEPLFYRKISSFATDFKMQNSNLLTYYDAMKSSYVGLDRNYNIIDSFRCGNGYYTDLHEVQVTPDGGAWLMSYDPQIIRMDTIVAGGKPNAYVIGLVIQKIDVNKNVVFQWLSWDHIPITDATHENLTADTIDYVHGNAIEVCPDGNIMISSRHLDEITKINTNTGSIIWRLGGKQNQFTFINDTIKFSHQHSVRVVSDSNIILFDNGNFHTPSFSRAVEYRINESNKTATQVWEFRHTPNVYGMAMGSVQRLSNGNTVIGWGTAPNSMTEVTKDGEVVYELSLFNGQMSYRAFRFEWDSPEKNTPYNYYMAQNYPNPFNSYTTIRFDIPISGNGNLTIYDITGRKVAVLFNKYIQKGSYYQGWNGLNYSSGVYFCRLTVGDYTEIKKMVLVK